ncbi:MAG: tetratricopeptide repeat protein [Bacteroidota bacterium]
MATLTLAACLSPRDVETMDARFLNLAPEVEYVGSASCASCHEEIYTSYQAHGMANSFYPVDTEAAQAWTTSDLIPSPSSPYAYRVLQSDGQWVQEEALLGDDRQPIARQTRTMDFVVGSGNAARTFLSQDTTGRLYQLPLTWYATDSGGRWAYSPGYDELNSRFDRTIPERCMACHNGTSEAVPFTDGRFASLAEGIGCEQCHGPGELHVEARTADPEAPDSMDVTIVNPKWLDIDLRLDVCQQCHLSADVSLLREGETATSYRPGRPLAAHRSLFAPAETDPNEVDVISHADRMKASACFQESASMDCVTCHDPHAAVPSEEAFSATCRSCHDPDALQASMPTPELQAQHGPDQTCVSCHMPKVEAADAPHASFTDHFVRVVEDEIESVAQAKDDALRPVFDTDAGNEVTTNMAYVVLGQTSGSRAAMTRGISGLADALDERTEAGEAQYLLGFARLQLGQARQAIDPLERAVEVEANPERLNALAQAYEQAGRLTEVEGVYRQALEIQPAAANVRINYGRFLEAQRRVDDARQAYRRAAADAPFDGRAHYNLGTLLAREGDVSGAIRSLREAVRLVPLNGDALTNLGVLLAQQGAEAEAGGFLRRAVNAEPGNANAQANLALYYANTGRLGEAMDRARAALQIDPAQPTAQQVLAALGG